MPLPVAKTSSPDDNWHVQLLPGHVELTGHARKTLLGTVYRNW